MPCVEYHLLLILICLMTSGISLDLGMNWVGTQTHITTTFCEAPDEKNLSRPWQCGRPALHASLATLIV